MTVHIPWPEQTFSFVHLLSSTFATSTSTTPCDTTMPIIMMTAHGDISTAVAALRGGHNYPPLIRKTTTNPIRVFIQRIEPTCGVLPVGRPRRTATPALKYKSRHF